MSRGNQKIALVTGAGRGLGADLAVRLGREGYSVAVHCHSSLDGASAVRETILQSGGLAEVFQADLSDPKQAPILVAKIVERLGPELTVLVNNAGVYHPTSLETLTSEEWLIGLHSTATATFSVTQASIPYLHLIKHGRVINIGDSSADRPSARDLAVGYHIGKTGVWMLTRSFAQSLAPAGVTVNMISPGYLDNSALVPALTEIPAGRLGTFDDIWVAVQFLLDEKADYISGSNIMVTGGWNLRAC